MGRNIRMRFRQPEDKVMSDVALASQYARRLVDYESRKTGTPIKAAIAPVARRLRTSNNAVFSLLFRVPKDVSNRLYSALEEAVSNEIAREIGALTNELAKIKGSRSRFDPRTMVEVDRDIETLEAGIARLRAKLSGESEH